MPKKSLKSKQPMMRPDKAPHIREMIAKSKANNDPPWVQVDKLQDLLEDDLIERYGSSLNHRFGRKVTRLEACIFAVAEAFSEQDEDIPPTAIFKIIRDEIRKVADKRLDHDHNGSLN